MDTSDFKAVSGKCLAVLSQVGIDNFTKSVTSTFPPCPIVRLLRERCCVIVFADDNLVLLESFVLSACLRQGF